MAMSGLLDGYQQLSDDDAAVDDGGEYLGARSDEEAPPSFLDKAKGVFKKAKKYKDYSEQTASATPTGKVLNVVNKGASAVDKLANAFPPAKAVTGPISTATSLAQKAHQGVHAYGLAKSGEMDNLLPSS